MRALFAHDHRFIPAEGRVWSESQFEAALWPRYLAHFEDLTVAARRAERPQGRPLATLELSSAPRVGFELFPNLSTIGGITLARPAAARRMRALVRRHDAVIARLPSEIGLLAVSAARAEGRPWAVEVAGCPADGMWNYGSLAGKLYAPIARARMRRTVACADHALYVTRCYLQGQYPSRARNMAAVSNVILPDVPRDALTRRMGRIAAAGLRPLRLGLIGTLRGRFKGIQTVFGALALARDALPPLRLHILGPGDPEPWRAAAKAQGIDDLVVFDGTLPAGAPVLAWLDEVDVYLQPSLKEGLPRALIEAMSRACPSLASGIAGIPELLPQDDLIAPGDHMALARLLRLRLSDRGWMAARAKRNWQAAQDYRADALEERRFGFWAGFAGAAASRAAGPDGGTAWAG